MIVTQRALQKLVPGFRFNLGFSGNYFEHGSADENEGDRELLENASEFRWFDHTWAHKQPHQLDSLEYMKQQIMLNMEFAKVKNPKSSTFVKRRFLGMTIRIRKTVRDFVHFLVLQIYRRVFLP